MVFDTQKSNQRLKGSLFVASALHISLAATLALSSALNQIPEGTNKIQIEFTAQEVSRGQQIETTNMGKDENLNKGKGSKTKKSKAQKAASAKILVKKKARKKFVAKKRLPKPARKKAKKIKKSVAKTNKGTMPVALPKKQKTQKSQSPEPKNSAEKGINVAGPLVTPKNLEDSIDEEIKAISDELDKEAPLKENVLASEQKKQAQKEKSLEALSENKKEGPHTSNNMAKKSGAPKRTNRSFGIKAGARDFRDLKQRQGNIKPVYSAYARKNGMQGQGLLQYYVNANGSIKSVSLIRSSGHRHLDKEAIRAISRYRYFPGQSGWTLHPYDFSLKGDAKQDSRQLLRTRAQRKDRYPYYK